MKRKIDKMYEMFGVSHEHKCKDCKHFHGGANEFKKCSVYGRTASEASDWAQSWVACGLFDKDWNGDIPIIRTLTNEVEDEQIEGQMNIFDYIN